MGGNWHTHTKTQWASFSLYIYSLFYVRAEAIIESTCSSFNCRLRPQCLHFEPKG